MKKYLMIVCLIVSMILPLVPSAAIAAGNGSNSSYDSASVDFAIQLGLLEPDVSGTLILSQAVTRAELAGMLRKMVHAPAAQNTRVALTDMTPADALYGDVAAALELGLFEAPESGLFRPDEPAYVYQLIGSALDILGYRKVIRNDSDWTVALRLGLFGGLSLQEVDILTKGQAAMICYNAMQTDMMVQQEYGENASYRIQEGKTILSDYWHAVSGKGVVQANERTGLMENTQAKEGYVFIDGKSYQEGDTNAASMLGYAVEYWAETDSDRLIYVWKTNANRSIQIPAGNIEEATRENIRYYASDADTKQQSAVFSGDVDILYNGRALFDFTTQDLMPRTGYVELIDNDGNGRYDVVSVWEYENSYIVGIDTQNYSVTDGLRGSIVDLDPEKRTAVDIRRWQQEASQHYASEFGELGRNMILSVMKSRDGDLITAVASSAKLSGEVTALQKDDRQTTIRVGETEVALSADFRDQLEAGNAKAIEPKVGMNAVFYLDFYGEVAFISTDLTDWQYGFMSQIALEGSFQKELKMRMFNDEGIWMSLDAASSIEVNDIRYKDHEAAYRALHTGESYQAQVVKYRLQPDGKVAKLQTAVDRTGESGYLGYDTEFFTKDASFVSSKYKTRDKSFGHQYSIELTTTTLFCIPDDAFNASGKMNEDKIELISNDFFINDSSYNVEFYDSSEYFIPRVAVVTGSATVNYLTDLFYVNEKIMTMNSATGELTYTLSGMQGNTAVSYVCRYTETAEPVEAGDVLEVLLYGDGTVSQVVRVANFAGNNMTGAMLAVGTDSEVDAASAYGLYMADVYNVDYERNAVIIWAPASQILKKFSGSYMKILVYDSKNQRFSVGDISRIHGSVNSSTPTRVFIHDRYLETRSLVIID